MKKTNISKMTLTDFFNFYNIKLNSMESVGYTTIRNIIRGHHDGKYNKNYRAKLPYFPTERTLSKLSLELGITYMELVRLIENQYKINKKVAKNKK